MSVGPLSEGQLHSGGAWFFTCSLLLHRDMNTPFCLSCELPYPVGKLFTSLATLPGSVKSVQFQGKREIVGSPLCLKVQVEFFLLKSVCYIIFFIYNFFSVFIYF